jgi:hypothetical protein
VIDPQEVIDFIEANFDTLLRRETTARSCTVSPSGNLPRKKLNDIKGGYHSYRPVCILVGDDD